MGDHSYTSLPPLPQLSMKLGSLLQFLSRVVFLGADWKSDWMRALPQMSVTWSKIAYSRFRINIARMSDEHRWQQKPRHHRTMQQVSTAIAATVILLPIF